MSDLTPTGIYEKLTVAGDDWADKRAAADLLDRNLKNALSLYFNKHKAAGKGVEEAKHLAQVEPEYQGLCEQAIVAQREALKAKVKYDSAQTFFEAWRTIEANHRAVSRAAT